MEESMHATTIRKDSTGHVPQVMSNMRKWKSTVRYTKPKTNANSSLSEMHVFASSDDEDDDTSFSEEDLDMDIDINRLDITEKKNKNIINLKRYGTNKNEKNSNKKCCTCRSKQCGNKCCYALPILHPHGNLRIGWDCIIMIILIWTCVEIPFTMAFNINLTLNDVFGVIALSIDCLLLCDVLLNFRTAYFDEFDQQMLVYNPKRIAWKYLTTWFILDFLTSIPFEFLIPEGSAAGNFPSLIKALRIFRMVRLLKLLRFFRMLKTFNSIIASFMTRSIIIIAKLFKLLCLMTLSAHFVSCLWFYVGTQSFIQGGPGNSWLYPDANDPSSSMVELSHGELYLTSFYFSVVTLYTTGYGDITPKSLNEKMAASVCILIGTCFFAYFIGAVGSLVADGDRVKCAQIQKVEEAQAFCTAKKLPAPVAHALMSHAKYHWERNFVFDDLDVMNALPGYLRRDVGNCLSEKYFSQLSIFDDLSPYIRGLIALRLRCVSCNSGYELFHAQQYGKEMFIQRTGVSYLLDHDRKLHKMVRGGVCGYYALLNPVRQTTLKCASWCEFYALDRDDIQDILRTNFPRAWRPLWIKIKTRIKELLQQNVATLDIHIKRNKALFEQKVPKFNPSTKSSSSASSSSSCDSITPKTSSLRRMPSKMPSLRLLSTDSVVIEKSVKAAKTAKKNTKRKIKRILEVSDSEMRNDKVLTKPPMSTLCKNKASQRRYEKKLKQKMMKYRFRREIAGVDEIIPKFNNNKPMINYFADIIEQENREKEQDPPSICDDFGHSSEEQYQNDEESEEWDADQDSEAEFDTAPTKRRGVAGVGGKRFGGFKGMKKIKLNKSSKGIKTVRTKKVRKKKPPKLKQNDIDIELVQKSEPIMNGSENEGLLNSLGNIDELQNT
eukprot:223714_1